MVKGANPLHQVMQPLLQLLLHSSVLVLNHTFGNARAHSYVSLCE
jgi:hypothetical protein